MRVLYADDQEHHSQRLSQYSFEKRVQPAPKKLIDTTQQKISL